VRERSLVLKAALFFATLVGVSYWPVFVGRVPLATDEVTQFPPFLAYHAMAVRTPHAELGDSITEVYPWRKFAAETVRSGVFPLWNPLLFAGTPFQANPLTALFYPFNLMFLLLPMPAAWSLSLMAKVFLAAIFTFLFMREIGASVSGAIVAAVGFGFGGFMTAWLAWPRVDTALWLPLLCFQIHRVCRKPSARQALMLAVALAMPILAGHPGMIARTLATAGAYALWIVVWQRSGTARRQLVWLSVAGCLALGITAVQLVPTIEWLSQIFRTLDMPDASLPFSQAVGFVSRDLGEQPNSAGIFIPEGAVYAGALSLLTAGFALFRRGRKDTAFFAFLFAITFCTAYGVSPFLELAQRLPVFRGLRMDEALVLTVLSLSILAGLGITYLENFQGNKSSKTEWLLGAGTLLLATGLFHHCAAILSRMTQPGTVAWWRSPRSFRVLLIVSALLVGLRLLQLLSRRQWVVLASLLIAADLVSYRYGHTPFNQVETIYPPAAMFEFLSRQPKPFRVISLNSAAPLNVEYVYGLATAGGYEYMLKRMAFLTETLTGEPANGYMLNFSSRAVVESDNRILDILNIKYLIATKFNDSETLLRTRPNRFREVWSDGNSSVFENLASLPKVRLIPRTNAETISSEEMQLSRLREGGFDPEHRVILSAPLEPQPGGGENHALPQGIVNYSEGINSIHVQVNAPAPSVLVLAQAHYPGWKVYVDGQPAELLRADYAFTGTTVAAGTHDVEFRFQPASFNAGLVVSLASVAVGIVAYRKAKRPSDQFQAHEREAQHAEQQKSV
jgi:hypothetical protein